MLSADMPHWEYDNKDEEKELETKDDLEDFLL